jgi:hypothetical protein
MPEMSEKSRPQSATVYGAADENISFGIKIG